MYYVGLFLLMVAGFVATTGSGQLISPAEVGGGRRSNGPPRDGEMTVRRSVAAVPRSVLRFSRCCFLMSKQAAFLYPRHHLQGFMVLWNDYFVLILGIGNKHAWKRGPQIRFDTKFNRRTS